MSDITLVTGANGFIGRYVVDRLHGGSVAVGFANGSFSFAVSGTGTSGMETAVANVTEPGRRALVVVTGYFGDRLAQMFERYGASVSRVDGEWGKACDPQRVADALAANGADIVAVVHGETST